MRVKFVIPAPAGSRFGPKAFDDAVARSERTWLSIGDSKGGTFGVWATIVEAEISDRGAAAKITLETAGVDLTLDRITFGERPGPVHIPDEPEPGL